MCSNTARNKVQVVILSVGKVNESDLACLLVIELLYLRNSDDIGVLHHYLDWISCSRSDPTTASSCAYTSWMDQSILVSNGTSKLKIFNLLAE